MNARSKIEKLLNMSDYREDWFRWYGLTERRKESLLDDRSHPNSLFNPNSESTLTLFMLGNLDDWNQPSLEIDPPRKTDSRWNPSFFEQISDEVAMKNTSIDKVSRWDKSGLSKIVGSDEKYLNNNILLFEVELHNDALHLGLDRSKENISFMDLTDAKRWVRYDAVMMIPEIKRLIFFESKLQSELSCSSEKYDHLDQMMKGLEGAHLITEKEGSPYNDWDYEYVLICPKLLDDYDLTRYNRKVKNIGRSLVRYNDLLNNRSSDSINDECYPQNFGSFIKKVPERIHKLYWKDLGKALVDSDRRFFIDYFNRLDECFDIKKSEGVKKRFREVGLRVKGTDNYKAQDNSY
ncbi:MAG: hypothetical protein ACLFSM_02780 [Thermoplasmata archaeon]